jgi:hypothetical protein
VPVAEVVPVPDIDAVDDPGDVIVVLSVPLPLRLVADKGGGTSVGRESGRVLVDEKPEMGMTVIEPSVVNVSPVVAVYEKLSSEPSVVGSTELVCSDAVRIVVWAAAAAAARTTAGMMVRMVCGGSTRPMGTRTL